MGAAEIAAKLTPAQVRTLRQYVAEKSPLLASIFIKDSRRMLESFCKMGVMRRNEQYPGVKHLTAFGCVVLLELDRLGK